VTDTEYPIIETALADDALPRRALSYRELHGFMFALVSTPDLIQPSEWLPVVFGDGELVHDSPEEARRVVGAFLRMYDDYNRVVQDEDRRLRVPFEFDDDPLANLEDDAPAAAWSSGFLVGHYWASESWEEYLPEEWDQEFGGAVAILSFFSSRSTAEAYLAEFGSEDSTLAEMARSCRDVFADAIQIYASMGQAIWKATWRERFGATATADVARSGPEVGRNDPCPCGSGKKYKKCCWRKQFN